MKFRKLFKMTTMIELKQTCLYILPIIPNQRSQTTRKTVLPCVIHHSTCHHCSLFIALVWHLFPWFNIDASLPSIKFPNYFQPIRRNYLNQLYTQHSDKFLLRFSEWCTATSKLTPRRVLACLGAKLMTWWGGDGWFNELKEQKYTTDVMLRENKLMSP